MEGTVNYEGSGDVFFAFFNGNEQLTTMPQKGQDLGFERADCTNGASVEWDNISWAPKVLNITKTKTKCTLYFSKNVSSTSSVEDLMENNRTMVEYDDTSDQNLRYIGATPNNYIDIGDRYSGDVYRGYYSSTNENSYLEYTTLEACQAGDGEHYNYGCNKVHNAGDKILWRIIGVMNNITVINEDESESTGQSLVKIIRAEDIGSWSWDSSASDINNGYGVNEWSQADLMKLLNPGYDENKSEGIYGAMEESYVNNSLYWNRKSGQCYSGSSNSQKACDFSSTGLTESVKNKIVKVRWNTGTYENVYDDNFPNKAYTAERSGRNYVKSRCSSDYSCNDRVSRTATWDGYIGLMYPSQYGSCYHL